MNKLIAVSGKGGVGKTSISALLVSRLIAIKLSPVLAIDADPNTCLDTALGVAAEKTVGRIREEAREIAGWPAFVNREFSSYPPTERLKAIALPLVMASPPFRITPTGRTFHGDLNEFTIEMEDFGIVWEESHAG